MIKLKKTGEGEKGHKNAVINYLKNIYLQNSRKQKVLTNF